MKKILNARLWFTQLYVSDDCYWWSSIVFIKFLIFLLPVICYNILWTKYCLKICFFSQKLLNFKQICFSMSWCLISAWGTEVGFLQKKVISCISGKNLHFWKVLSFFIISIHQRTLIDWLYTWYNQYRRRFCC